MLTITRGEESWDRLQGKSLFSHLPQTKGHRGWTPGPLRCARVTTWWISNKMGFSNEIYRGWNVFNFIKLGKCLNPGFYEEKKQNINLNAGKLYVWVLWGLFFTYLLLPVCHTRIDLFNINKHRKGLCLPIYVFPIICTFIFLFKYLLCGILMPWFKDLLESFSYCLWVVLFNVPINKIKPSIKS